MTAIRGRDKLYAERMLEAIAGARGDSAVGFPTIATPGKDQKALRLDLFFLCESADRLSPAFHAANGGIDWDRLHDLRNHGLVYEYESFEPEDAWRFVTI